MAQAKHEAEHRLRYLDGPGFRAAPFLRLLMLFYGNLLGLLITENRTHILKDKVSITGTQTHTGRRLKRV